MLLLFIYRRPAYSHALENISNLTLTKHSTLHCLPLLLLLGLCYCFTPSSFLHSKRNNLNDFNRRNTELDELGFGFFTRTISFTEHFLLGHSFRHLLKIKTRALSTPNFTMPISGMRVGMSYVGTRPLRKPRILNTAALPESSSFFHFC